MGWAEVQVASPVVSLTSTVGSNGSRKSPIMYAPNQLFKIGLA